MAAEQAIAASGVRHTFLRHSMDADFVPFFAVLEGDRAVIAAPAGDGRTSFVSRDDCADVEAAVLLDESGRFDGQALDVTGPAALTMTEAAAVLAEVTGRPAGFRDQTVEEAWATRRPSGHPDWEVEGWVTSYLAVTHRVVCAALLRDGRVLLGHRSPGRRWYPDVWDLPGGHVDDGETTAAALAREIWEELGVRIEVPARPPDAVLSDADLHLSAWVVRRCDGEVVNAAADEHDELRWVDAAGLDVLQLAHPGYRDLLAGWLTGD